MWINRHDTGSRVLITAIGCATVAYTTYDWIMHPASRSSVVAGLLGLVLLAAVAWGAPLENRLMTALRIVATLIAAAAIIRIVFMVREANPA